MHRELNEIEYFNWCVDQPYNMVVAVKLNGELEVDALRAALDKAQLRHPLLRVNTELGPRGVPWFYSEGVGSIPLTVVADAEPERARKHFEAELSALFSRDRRGSADLPLIRVSLFLPREAVQRCELVFSVQHVIADGLSMVFLVRDLLCFIEQPSAPVLELDATAESRDLLTEQVRRRIPTSSRRFRLALGLAKLYVRLRFRRQRRAPPARVQHQMSFQLTTDETKRLRACCHHEGVSVQSALCTALLSRFSAIHSPVNLRPYLARSVGEAVGLFVGAAELRLRYRAERGFWHEARRVQRRLQRALRDPFGIFRLFSKAVPRELVRQLGPLLVKIMSAERPFAITNLGDLDRGGLLPQAGRLRLESFVGAVSGIVESSVLTVYTLECSMRFHLLANEASATDTSVRDDVERALSLLRRALD